MQPGRGIHALTTSDHDEAFTMLHAVELRDALRDVLAWRDPIIEAAGSAHGGTIHTRIAEALYQAEIVLAMAGIPASYTAPRN
jgi:hypothetical protein